MAENWSPDVIHCPICGEADDINRISRETGKQMIVEVYECGVDGKQWAHWIEQKHKPFRQESG